MRRIKKPFLAIIAAILITITAFAGDIPGPGAGNPPTCSASEPCDMGDIPGPGIASLIEDLLIPISSLLK